MSTKKLIILLHELEIRMQGIVTIEFKSPVGVFYSSIHKRRCWDTTKISIYLDFFVSTLEAPTGVKIIPYVLCCSKK